MIRTNSIFRSFLRACALMDWRAYRSMAFLSLLILLNTGLEIVGIGLVPPFIALVSEPERTLEIPVLRRIYDIAGFSDTAMLLAFCGLAFVVLIALKNAMFLYLAHYGARFSFGQAAQLSNRLFAGYMNAPYAAHLRWRTPDLITTTDATADQAATRVIYGGINAVTETFILIGIGIMLLVVEPEVTLLVIGVLGGIFFLLFRALQRRMGEIGAQDIAVRRQRLECVQQGFGSIKELKLLGRERIFLERFAGLRAAHARLITITTTMQQLPRAVIETLLVGGIMAMVAMLLWQGRSAASIIGVLGLFSVAAFRLMPSLTRLMMALNNLRYGSQAVDRITADLARLPAPVQNAGPARVLRPLRDEIELRDVSFAYPEAGSPALEAVALTIRRGESIGIVGPSGAGKSTLVDLILGILTPDRGQILVDGTDIAGNPRGWQAQLGYVPQSIALIDASIRQNIALGLPDQEIDDERVRRALRLARLDELVATAPEGMAIEVGERGVRLSGGQRQRIGIARALYHDPAVLIMDEATSALDSETESEITRALDALRGSKTLIVIAHRLTTLRGCDRLIYLEGGRVRDVGSFSELAARSTGFRTMLECAGVTPAASPAA